MTPAQRFRFGEKLRELRTGAAMTQAQLAKRAGLHVSAVARFEQGLREPSLATAADLAQALGAKVDDFLQAPVQRKRATQRGRPRKGK